MTPASGTAQRINPNVIQYYSTTTQQRRILEQLLLLLVLHFGQGLNFSLLVWVFSSPSRKRIPLGLLSPLSRHTWEGKKEKARQERERGPFFTKRTLSLFARHESLCTYVVHTKHKHN